MTTNEIRKLAGRVVMIGFRGTEAGPDTLIATQIRELRPAGVILFDIDTPTGRAGRNIVSPEQVTTLCSQLRAIDPALLIAIDQEGGQVARLHARNGFRSWPTHSELGRRSSAEETTFVSTQIAELLIRLGINFNLAPVVDLNLNPHSPIIGSLGRSFGADAQLVTTHARAWIDGHRKHGVAWPAPLSIFPATAGRPMTPMSNRVTSPERSNPPSCCPTANCATSTP